MTRPKRLPVDLRSLARAHTPHVIRVLSSIALRGQNEGARVAACVVLLDRGWGKAEQPHTGNVDADIRITIRQIISGEPEPKTIEHKDE